MAKLKEVKLKISAVTKTRQITKAMNMVAASKLRGAQTSMENFRPYARKFAEVLGSLAEKAGSNTNPLLIPHEDVKKIHVVLCTSDRGLCGGFNTNLIETAEKFIKNRTSENTSISFTVFGKKGRDWCRSEKLNIENAHIGIMGTKINFNVASTTGRKLVDAYLGNVYDEVHIVYAEFKGMAKQLPQIKQLLPIPPVAAAEALAEEQGQHYIAEHICEPSPEVLLGNLLPRNVYIQIFSALLETSTSEHAARMMAMDNATKACNDMIGELKLAYNKVRQASITSELMDIVGGAEALKG